MSASAAPRVSGVSDGVLRIAVVRLGMLGDLVMTLPALGRLAAAGLPPTLVTDAHHQPLMARVLPSATVVSSLPAGPWDAALDLHGTAAARRVVRSVRAPIVVRTRKDSLPRRGLLRTPGGAVARVLTAPSRPRRSWPERHLDAVDRLLARLGVPAPPPTSAIPRLPGRPERSGAALGLVVGARHGLKRWPVSSWRELAHAWRSRTGLDVITLAAPWEQALAHAVGEPVVAPALEDLPEALRRCAVVVAGDTGPLHLAGALGVPTVGLFGPTPVDAGFWVWEGRSRALTPTLPCSPCSLHGADACRRSDRLCLDDRAVADVLAAALAVGGLRRRAETA